MSADPTLASALHVDAPEVIVTPMALPVTDPVPAPPDRFPATPDHRLRAVVSFTLPSSGEKWHWPMDRSSVDVFVEILDRANIAWEVRHG